MGDDTQSPLNIAPYYRVKHYPTLDSTSLEAKRIARIGDESAGLWVLADEQSAGKGRMGRTWVSDKGNLFTSLLIFPACDIAKNVQLSFVSAVAVAATLREFTNADVACKWPNDVLINGQKVAGILLETESTGNPQKPWVVIGIGINITSHPDVAEYPATALNAHLETPAERDRVFEVLTHKMAEAINRWARDGFSSIRVLWLNQAFGRGQEIKIDTGDGVLEGTMAGLSKTGALLLQENGGKVHEILSGTVLKD